MSSIRRAALVAALSGIVLALPRPGLAQLVSPQPLENAAPDAPEGPFGMPREGWAVVRFSVLADGHTENVRVVRVMPPGLPDGPIGKAVEKWRFEPATEDGTALDWHNNETIILFDAPDVPLEPLPYFLRGYLEVEDLVKEQKLDKALARNERLLRMEASRLREFGLAEMQRAVIQMRLGDAQSAYLAIRESTDPGIPVLEPADLRVALEYRTALELQLGDVVAALNTIERRQAQGDVPDGDPVAEQAAAIRSALEGDSAIAVQGRIVDRTWSHTLSRRTFAFGDVDGKIDAIHVECDRRRGELEYSADSEWSLPESWGNCVVMLDGRRDTAFVFYEFR